MSVGKEKKPRLTRADLDARFSAHQEKNRVRRETKVTREDVEQLFKDKKAQRLENASTRAPGHRARLVSIGLGVALLVASGVITTSASASTNAFTRDTQTLEQRVATLTGDLKAIPAADEDGAAVYAADLEAQISAATTKATEVASLQQTFASILFRGNGESSGNGAPSPAFLESVEHRRLLAPYFVDQALIAEGTAAYEPGSRDPFADDEIDPRFPWYIGYEPDSEGRTVVDPGVSTWTMASVIATAADGVFDVTWLNQSSSTNDVFSWATASYYVEPGAFGHVILGKTTLGEQAVSTQNADGE